MRQIRPMAIAIAGFDPSAGAGLLADIKTMEQHRVYGLGVLSANTIQSDSAVKGVIWTDASVIIAQLQVLMTSWKINWFKIGIVEDSIVLLEIIRFIKSKNPDAQFVWDPVLHSSSGYTFFSLQHNLQEVLRETAVVTPNLPEFEALIGAEDKAVEMSWQTAVYLKGGHNKDKLGVDILYLNGEKHILEPNEIGTAKHGSGCVFASALCANLALGYRVCEASVNAKRYIESVLTSNDSLLGWHAHNDR